MFVTFVLVLELELVFKLVPTGLYNNLSNSVLPPNSPLTILSVTTTSNPHPRPSPPPALIKPSSPPPSVNLERSKSYSLTKRPFINVVPELASARAHDKNPFPAHEISSLCDVNGCIVGRGREDGEGSRAYNEKSRDCVGAHSGL